MNSKLRCSFCHGYYAYDSNESFRVGLSGVCSSQCLNDLKDKSRRKRARRVIHRENKHRYGRRLPGQIRDKIRERDGSTCRFCGSSRDIQIHHVMYRSQGGSDVEWNLISLCATHHELVHSSKRRWQPVVQMTLWIYYNNGLFMTVPEVERAFAGCLQAEADDGHDADRE